MSSLESKLSASLQSSRRRSEPAKATEHEHPSKQEKAHPKQHPATDHKSTDLNDGGGRGRNPDRIWPD